jgi:signal transduction histidine kinase/ActR/RegA family two-component response regulator
MSAVSETVTDSKPKAAPPASLALFAASAKNLLPRLIHNTPVAAMLWIFIGPWVSAGWFMAVWAIVFVGVTLMSRIQQVKPGSAQAKTLGYILNGVNMTSGAISASSSGILWLSGDPIAGAFAIVALFISATYVLLQYYSDQKIFSLYLVPYVIAAAVLFGSWGVERNFDLRVFAAVLGVVTCLVNFFILSRGQLDGSRTALRAARGKAREGEQAAEAANAAKSAFLATMSHEIRTPLNGVLGMAQAMAADQLSAVQRDRLSVVQQSGEALLAILNDILDLSKIEAGKLELEEIPFDLGEVARGAHSAFTALANKKGLSFALDIDQARGVYRGDPTRIRQILYNLISNALKFTDRGEIRVVGRYSPEGLRIAVSDTGVGISEEAIGRLFSKFGQADASTTRRFGGTGLGLAICQQLAKLMGGAVSVTSTVGEGSTFEVIVPLERIGDERAVIPISPPTEGAGAPEALAIRVLAAEDNTVNQLVLKTLLHQIGVEPVIVNDGREAVTAWEASEWDVILMDVQMPELDGPSATREIRQKEAAAGRARTPIIALTANAMSHQVSEYLAAGMDGFVAKPIEVARLFEALQAVLPEEPEEEAAKSA